MGKTKFCRICRTVENLKYSTKQLRQLNKDQLLFAETSQQGQTNNRASKKLLLTTPTLGNICQVCDERIQIFHRLDDGGHESSSDVEIDVVSNMVESHINVVDNLSNQNFVQRTQRPETPVIVDDDDMLFNIFMRKFDQKTQLQRNQISSSFSQQQMEKQLTNEFHSTYTPPQSTGGSSEGDESKIIEVLTSRENTPTPIQSIPAFISSSQFVDPQGHRIVAIIELDDCDDSDEKNFDKQMMLCTSEASTPDECIATKQIEHRSVSVSTVKNFNFKSSSTLSTCQIAGVDDDEEIVFRKVECEKSPTSKKKKRKMYDEKNLRLVASLNLVSSDSEAEDTLVKDHQLKKVSNTISIPSSNSAVKSFICGVCEIKFPDSESLSVHERIHQGVKCILCQFGFQQVKRLIHHMRRKHREYNGDALSEKPRAGQDSCMTIRLRYMQKTTFYECQLCGRIDDIFREHKEHIIEKHPNESKSLKDPIMKQLKCPVCKAKCGVQYLSLCRHLRSSHDYREYKSHLRELLHAGSFGWNVARQKEVTKTAKIFQFVKRKTFFFECKICCKVMAGYLHHLRHVNEHQNTSDTKAKITSIKESSSLKTSGSSSNTLNLEKLCKTQNKDRVCIAEKLRKRDSLSKTLVCHKNFHKNIKIIENHLQKVQNANKNVKSKKTEAEPKNQIVKKIQFKNKSTKPEQKEVVKLSNCSKSIKTKSKNEKHKVKNLKKQSSKLKDVKMKLQMKKVKVKAPIKQIDLQKYKCKYCLKKYKGFRLYNLHILRQHKENEFYKCIECNKFFTSCPNLEEHSKKCIQGFFTSKQKRKFNNHAQLAENVTEVYQPIAKKVPRTTDVCSNYFENNLWLKDLLKLNEPLEIIHRNLYLHKTPKSAFFNLQCCYCLHFFVDEENLKEHKELHHLQCSDIFLRYKPLRKP